MQNQKEDGKEDEGHGSADLLVKSSLPISVIIGRNTFLTSYLLKIMSHICRNTFF